MNTLQYTHYLEHNILVAQQVSIYTVSLQMIKLHWNTWEYNFNSIQANAFTLTVRSFVNNWGTEVYSCKVQALQKQLHAAYLMLYEELRVNPSGPVDTTETNTWPAPITWGFSNVTGIDIPSSDIRDGRGDSVPLVRIKQCKLLSNSCFILWTIKTLKSEVLLEV